MNSPKHIVKNKGNIIKKVSANSKNRDKIKSPTTSIHTGLTTKFKKKNP